MSPWNVASLTCRAECLQGLPGEQQDREAWGTQHVLHKGSGSLTRAFGGWRPSWPPLSPWPATTVFVEPFAGCWKTPHSSFSVACTTCSGSHVPGALFILGTTLLQLSWWYNLFSLSCFIRYSCFSFIFSVVNKDLIKILKQIFVLWRNLTKLTPRNVAVYISISYLWDTLWDTAHFHGHLSTLVKYFKRKYEASPHMKKFWLKCNTHKSAQLDEISQNGHITYSALRSKKKKRKKKILLAAGKALSCPGQLLLLFQVLALFIHSTADRHLGGFQGLASGTLAIGHLSFASPSVCYFGVQMEEWKDCIMGIHILSLSWST